MFAHPSQTKPSCMRSPAEVVAAVTRNRKHALRSDLSGAVQITHGRYFWPMEPDHPGNDYDIEFIAHVLAGDRRWAGVTTTSDGDPSNYSVAQHCVHVADIVNLNRKALVPGWDWDAHPAPTLYGLMHDASEAYIRDVVRPLKPHLGGYYDFEDGLMVRIISEFEIPLNLAIREAVRRVDNMMIFLERDELVGIPVVPYINELDHPRLTIHDVVPDFRVWSAYEAKDRFLRKFDEINNSAGNQMPLEYRNRGYRL